jgi:N-acetylglucosamine malate deacetylase 1
MNSTVRSVLAIGAHPDDVEISCSGTLKLLQNAGLEIHVATMSAGDCGSSELSRQAIAEKRRREAENACELLQAEYHYVGFQDFAIFNDDNHNRHVTALLRRAKPDIVFTHPPSDYIADHEITSILVRNACFYAGVKNYETSGIGSFQALSRIPYLFYFDAIEGLDIFGRRQEPEFYVDIAAHIEFKTEMLSCHESQREWLLVHHGVDDYLSSMRLWATIRGREASRASGRQVSYGEAFRQHRGHAYPASNVLKELLGAQVIENPEY